MLLPADLPMLVEEMAHVLPPLWALALVLAAALVVLGADRETSWKRATDGVSARLAAVGFSAP